jgi:phage repressor protein C with HTH and peptisase S24 domain
MTAAERLKQAREAAGFGSAAAFARATDAPDATYRSHENGTRDLTIAAAKRYARGLKRSWEWLMFGDAFPLARPNGAGPPAGADEAKSDRILVIDEVESGAGAGHRRAKIIGTWSIPATVVRYHTSAPEAALKIIRIVGDSMEPDYRAGERVMVDTADRLPSPSGVFAVWDGFSEIVKRLELVPYSDPPLVKVMSVNPAYAPRELRLDEMVIHGRVIGKWTWT